MVIEGLAVAKVFYGLCQPNEDLQVILHEPFYCLRFGMAGNICRCTGYQNIVKSILAAAAEMSASKEAAE